MEVLLVPMEINFSDIFLDEVGFTCSSSVSLSSWTLILLSLAGSSAYLGELSSILKVPEDIWSSVLESTWRISFGDSSFFVLVSVDIELTSVRTLYSEEVVVALRGSEDTSKDFESIEEGSSEPVMLVRFPSIPQGWISLSRLTPGGVSKWNPDAEVVSSEDSVSFMSRL